MGQRFGFMGRFYKRYCGSGQGFYWAFRESMARADAALGLSGSFRMGDWRCEARSQILSLLGLPMNMRAAPSDCLSENCLDPVPKTGRSLFVHDFSQRRIRERSVIRPRAGYRR
ncbi:MAG: hypothetical protein OSB19_01615, partial [Opitutaceae bacterium]|nr:hypothetical protein [Opitutaceae bacterium]